MSNKRRRKQENKRNLHAAMINAGVDPAVATNIVNSSTDWNTVWTAGQNAIANVPPKTPDAPPAPTPKAAPEKTQLKSSLKASGGGIRANRLSKRRKRGQANAINALANYIPLMIGSVGYSGSANIA